MPRLSKRQKFFIATAVLIFALLLIRAEFLTFISWRYRALSFAVLSGLLTIWSLFDEDFSGVEWLTLPILPVFLSLSAALVYPLLPVEINSFLVFSLDTDSGLFLAFLAKIVFLAIFALGFYAALLTSNILNVAALRTIQLLRVAHSIGFLLSLVCVVLGSIVIFSLHLPAWANFLAVFGLTFPLAVKNIWSVNLEPNISRLVLSFSLTLTLILAQLTWVLSFWPVSVYIFSLFLAACFYGGVGAVQYHISGRLVPAHIRELILVVGLFFYLTIFTTSWTG